MPRINLLPWREELRKQRQKELGLLAVLVVVAMAGVVFLVHMQVEEMIRYQEQRNARLDAEIAVLNRKIAEIRDLEREKQNLVARMRIVERLQTSRPEVVHLFDEIAKTVPEGVRLTSLAQSGRSVTLNGLAQSNARVSSFMRALDASPWLRDPDLKRIEAVERQAAGGTVRVSNFNLVVRQVNPQLDGDTEGEP
jgi:type IV pilus assembly protein PilN